MLDNHNTSSWTKTKFKHNPFYEGYVFNKHPCIPYPTNLAIRATKLLDLLHTNLCSPMQTPSHG